MAKVYSKEMTIINAGKAVYAGVVGGRVRRYRATVELKAQAADDVIELIEVPANKTFAFGVIFTSVTLGKATLAIGTADDPDAYMVAKTVTTADAPVFFGTADAASADTTAKAGKTTITATVGSAALPASGTLVIDVYASDI